MKNFIHKHLTYHYELSTNEESGKKIHLIINYGIYHKDEHSKVKELIYPKDLLNELVSIFSIPECDAKKLVNNWVKRYNKHVNLKWYWKQSSFGNLAFPVIQQVISRTIGMDLVSVQPMAGPTGLLHFLDFSSTGTTEPNRNGRVYDTERMNDINQIFINQQNMMIEEDGPRPRQSWFNPRND